MPRLTLERLLPAAAPSTRNDWRTAPCPAVPCHSPSANGPCLPLQTAWNEVIVPFLWGVGDEPPLRYRLLPIRSFFAAVGERGRGVGRKGIGMVGMPHCCRAAMGIP